MRNLFTLKLMFISLLTAMSMVAKADYIEFKTKDGLCYELDTETKSAVLSQYEGSANKVVIPKSVVYKGVAYNVTSLDDFCFAGCSSLTAITIPSSVTSLGEGCFADCSSLASIRVEANNPVYDSRENCNAIIETKTNTMISGCKNTNIPSSVTSLGDYCFRGCSSLTSITIPSAVSSLGFGCFEDCSSLTSITIPSSITSLGHGCFHGCSSLTSITIPSSVTNLGHSCFSECSSLTSITIPPSVPTLGNGCFWECSSLTSITIPSSVTSFGDGCFFDCTSLASITIPSAVKSLGDDCFFACSSLKTIICEIPTPIEGDFFHKTPIDQAMLYVPSSSLSSYRSSKTWNEFRTIQPIASNQPSKP